MVRKQGRSHHLLIYIGERVRGEDGHVRGRFRQKPGGINQMGKEWQNITKFTCALIKKKIKFSSYIRKFRVEQLQRTVIL